MGPASVAGGVKVTFKKQKTKYQECVAWRETDKIDGFEDGRLVYRQECTSSKWVTVDVTPQPTVVAARFAQGLAPGRYVWLRPIGDATTYAPVATHAGADASSKVVARYGVRTP